MLFEILKRGNFRCTDSSVGVETQLSNLGLVIQVIDPKLHQHLGMVQNSRLFTPYILVNLCFILKCYFILGLSLGHQKNFFPLAP